MKNLLLRTQRCSAFFLLVLSVSLFAGCSSRPSAADGRQAVQNQINQDAQGRIKLVEFHKTNGQSAEINAVKVYTLEFEAQIEFTEDCKWVIGNFGQQLSFRTSKPVTQQQAGVWGQFIDNAVSNPGTLVKKGERVQLLGVIHYEKKENGWSVDGIDLNRANAMTSSSSPPTEVTQSRPAERNAAIVENGSPRAEAKSPQINSGRAIAAAKGEIGILKTALDAFKLDTGHYPKSLSELIQNSDSDPNWHGPYISGSTIPKDPWGHEYIYKMQGTQNTDSYDLMSMGPNGEPFIKKPIGMPTVSSNSEKIVGSWNFNVNASIDMVLVAHPKITPAELKGLRGLWSKAYARTTFVATADHRAALENVPRFRVERGVGMTSEKVTFEGQWRNDGPNYDLSLYDNGQSRAMTASLGGSRLTLKSGNEVWVFDRGNAPAIIAETSAPNKANEAQELMVVKALIQIDGAKQQWALETGQGPKAVPTAGDLKPYLPNHEFPVHPPGGTYIINALDQSPESSEYGKLDKLKIEFHDQLHPKPSTPDFANMTSDQVRTLVINDLRMIDGAEQQWALENGKAMGAIPTEANLKPYLPGGYFPEHPPGGHFIINAVGQPPASSTYGTLSNLSP